MKDPRAEDVLIGLPDGRTARHSEIVRSVSSRIRLLAPYRGNAGGVRCLCRPGGVPLGVAHRAVPSDTFYLYPLKRGDWQRHDPNCALGRPPIPGATRPGRPAIERLPDRVVLHLSLPRYRRVDAPEVEPRDGPGGDLDTLLALLWTEAELDRWHPCWKGKRTYEVVRRRLLRAAGRIYLCHAEPWADRLYIPPPFRAPRKIQIENQFRAFLDGLRPANGRAPYGYFLGVLAEVRDGRRGGRALRLAHTPHLLWLSREGWERFARRSHPAEKDACAGRTVVLAQASRKGETGWLKVRDVAVLPVTAEWMPLRAEGEARGKNRYE